MADSLFHDIPTNVTAPQSTDLLLLDVDGGGSWSDGKMQLGVLATFIGDNYTTSTGVDGTGIVSVLSIESDAKTVNDGVFFDFDALNDGDNPTTYGSVGYVITDPSDASEDADAYFKSMQGGTLTTFMYTDGDEVNVPGSFFVTGATTLSSAVQINGVLTVQSNDIDLGDVAGGNYLNLGTLGSSTAVYVKSKKLNSDLRLESTGGGGDIVFYNNISGELGRFNPTELNFDLSATKIITTGTLAAGATTITGTLSASTRFAVGTTPHATYTGWFRTASAGAVTANTQADEGVFENSDHGGVSVLVGDTKFASYYLGSTSLARGARIRWQYSNSALVMATTKAGATFVLGGDNDVANLTLSGAISSELATFAGNVTLSNGDLELSAGTILLNGSITPASMVGGAVLFSGTDPTAGAANAVALYSTDLTAGNTILGLFAEGSGILATGTPAGADGAIAMEINGTVRYLTYSDTAPS